MDWSWSGENNAMGFLNKKITRWHVEKVLGKIINHEMMEEDAKYVKSFAKGVTSGGGAIMA